MVEFKCIYCGQGLSANEDDRGKNGICPKCNHDYFVPKVKPSQAPLKSDIYVTDYEWASFYKELFPAYDELSLFLTAFTLIMLFIANDAFRELMRKLFMTDYGRMFFYFVAAVPLAGFALSIYHFYSERDKTDFEKWAMFIFALCANICTAVVAGIYTLNESAGWVVIFPVWNLINAVLMVLMNVHIINQRCTTIYRYCITDRQATFNQMTLSITAVFLIFMFCNFIFDLHWAVTFSICIAYTTSFDRALQSAFPHLSNQSGE
jgi:DNA-directed RNA polymerase subunit RPC12/RpoP